MRVRDVMSRKVRTIDAGESIQRAGARMQAAGVHQLVVRDGRRRLVGVIALTDVRAAPEGGAVGDFMSRKLLTIRPNASLGSAAALMREHAIGSLPVMDGTRLAGIVTVSDLLSISVDEIQSRSPTRRLAVREDAADACQREGHTRPTRCEEESCCSATFSSRPT